MSVSANTINNMGTWAKISYLGIIWRMFKWFFIILSGILDQIKFAISAEIHIHMHPLIITCRILQWFIAMKLKKVSEALVFCKISLHQLQPKGCSLHCAALHWFFTLLSWALWTLIKAPTIAGWLQFRNRLPCMPLAVSRYLSPKSP